jgi:hypothetical protein
MKKIVDTVLSRKEFAEYFSAFGIKVEYDIDQDDPIYSEKSSCCFYDVVFSFPNKTKIKIKEHSQVGEMNFLKEL